MSRSRSCAAFLLLLAALLFLVLVPVALAQTTGPETLPNLQPQGLSNLAEWNLIVSFFLPAGIALVNQHHWSSSAKAVVAFLICALVGGITAYLQGQFNPADVVGSILLVLVSTVATFKALWEPTGWADAIEIGTSVAPPSPPVAPPPAAPSPAPTLIVPPIPPAAN